MLRSTAPRESQRFDLSLARGLFLLAATVLTFPTAAFAASSGAAAGSVALGAFFLSSFVLAAGLAGRLTGDAVGDRTSGTLELLSLTGLSAGQWLTIRLSEIWTAFLSVWAIRVPLLSLIFCLGGVRFERIVAQEVLLLATFAVFSSFAMLLAHRAESRKQVNQRVTVWVIACEILLVIPKACLGVLTAYTAWSPPPVLQEAADHLIRLQLTPVLRSAMEGGPDWSVMGPPLAFYGTLSLLALLRLKMLLFALPQDHPLSTGNGKRVLSKHRRRASRRCWDDALAWQAYAVHDGAEGMVQVKALIYVLVLFVLGGCYALGWKEAGLTIGLLAAGLGLILLSNKPGDCLQRELKEQTLAGLLLTPHEPADLYDGWHRGARLLCRVDLIYAGLMLAIAFGYHTGVGQVMLGVGGLLVASGPFMMLSPLVPFTFQGVVSGLGMVCALAAIIVFGIVLCTTVHPIFLLVVSVPLWWLFNLWLRASVLPKWMERKTSSIV